MKKSKSKTQQRRADQKPEGFLTIGEMGKLLGLSYIQVQTALKKKVVPQDQIRFKKIKWYTAVVVHKDAAELIKKYYQKPVGWLTVAEVMKSLGYTSEGVIVRNIRSIPGGEKYRKLKLGRYYYDPAVLPILESMKRPFVRVVNPPPAGVEWFKPRDFIAIFGRSPDSLENWISTGKIPEKLIKWTEAGHRRISREAIACIDGVILDYSSASATTKEALPPESDELIEMDGYCLTKEEHARRLDCKKRGLSAGLIDHKGTSC